VFVADTRCGYGSKSRAPENWRVSTEDSDQLVTPKKHLKTPFLGRHRHVPPGMILGGLLAGWLGNPILLSSSFHQGFNILNIFFWHLGSESPVFFYLLVHIIRHHPTSSYIVLHHPTSSYIILHHPARSSCISRYVFFACAVKDTRIPSPSIQVRCIMFLLSVIIILNKAGSITPHFITNQQCYLWMTFWLSFIVNPL
jgi:hypothetical protein